MAFPKIRLTIDSCLEEVALLGIATRALARYAGLDEDGSNQCELCVTEAANNVIKHGYAGESGREVTLVTTLVEAGVELCLMDTGKAIPAEKLNPDITVHPGDVTDIDSLPTGGMGLWIIKASMDEVRYASSEGVNSLTLIKRRG